VTFTSRFVSSEETGGSDQLILDMTDTLFDLDDKTSIDVNGTSHLAVSPTDILSVEGAQVGVVPYNTRFVINMDREIPYKAEYDSESKEIRVAFSGRIKEPKPEEPVVEEKPDGQRLIVLDAGHGETIPGPPVPSPGSGKKN